VEKVVQIVSRYEPYPAAQARYSDEACCDRITPDRHPVVIQTTQTYAHVQADALRRAVGVLDKFDLGKKEAEGIPVNTTAG